MKTEFEYEVWIRSRIEQERLNLYHNRISKPWISVVKEVTADDEWLAEAYMETDYSQIWINNFEDIRNNDYNISVSTYVEKEDTREKVDINELNVELDEIVARENVLRIEIEKIIKEIEG